MMGRHRKPPKRLPRRALVSGLIGAAAFVAVPAVPAVAVPMAERTQPDLPVIVPLRVNQPEPAAAPASAAPTEVTVERGDTLDKIARAHGQSWQDLWQRNLAAVANPNALRVGQVLSLVAPIEPLPAPAPAASPPPAPSAAPAEASAVVAKAREWFGTPYVYGGKSASGVDCSGLVFNVLKSVGLTDTYRTSGSLRSWAKPISKAEAQAGDLVFGPGHVAIYAGNGMMIDAPKPGKTVGLRRVYSNMTSYGRVPT